VDAYRIYDGTDENGIVGTVAPGLVALKIDSQALRNSPRP
jgi:hypothetical protein